MLAALLDREVVITSTVASDDDFASTAPTATETTTRGYLEQRSRTELQGQGEFSDTSWLLILPADAVIGTADKVTVDGQPYEVAGDPWPVSLDGRIHHIEATVERAGQ